MNDELTFSLIIIQEKCMCVIYEKKISIQIFIECNRMLMLNDNNN